MIRHQWQFYLAVSRSFKKGSGLVLLVADVDELGPDPVTPLGEGDLAAGQLVVVGLHVDLEDAELALLVLFNLYALHRLGRGRSTSR